MASLKEHTDEQLNYHRICFVTTDILAGLREIFKQEWGKLYKSTKGEWKDEPRNGMDFYNEESLRNKKKKRSSSGHYKKRKQRGMGLYNAFLRYPFL